MKIMLFYLTVAIYCACKGEDHKRAREREDHDIGSVVLLCNKSNFGEIEPVFKYKWHEV